MMAANFLGEINRSTCLGAQFLKMIVSGKILLTGVCGKLALVAPREPMRLAVDFQLMDFRLLAMPAQQQFAPQRKSAPALGTIATRSALLANWHCFLFRFACLLRHMWLRQDFRARV